MKKRCALLLALILLAGALTPGAVFATEAGTEQESETAETQEAGSGEGSGAKTREDPRKALAAALEKSPIGADEVIADGVFVGDTDISGMTAEEALEAVLAQVDEMGQRTLTLTLEGAEGIDPIKVPLSRLGLCAEGIAETIMEALSLGKSGSLITRYKAEKDLEISNQKYELELAVDEGLVKTFVADETSALSVEPVNAELTRVSGGFEVSQSQTGIKVNADATAAAVMAALKDWDGGDVSVAATAEVSQPERTTEMLSQVQDVLGTFSTSTSSANSSKLQNLRVGVSHTTDILIMPGETWSMHDALAPFNAENGYVKQVAYSNGGYVDEYGGGICQLATTLYNAALLAEVNISERYNHSMTVGYTDYGLDATINDSGSKDLKITNDFDFPIYIEASVNGSYNTYTIWGKETRPANRELKFYGVTLSESYLPEQVTEDPTLAPGQRVVEQATSYPEAVAQAWKEIWVDGVLEEKILLHTDKYRASPRKIRQNSAAAPETEAPETEAPTTEAPTTTAAPTTEAPTTTAAPTTEAPTTTAAPATEAPTEPAAEAPYAGAEPAA